MGADRILLFDTLEKKIDNRGKTPPLSESGYPLIEVKHIKEDQLYPVIEDTKFVDQETWDNWFRDHLKHEDILFSTVGSIARSCIVPENPVFCIAQNVLGFRVNRHIAVPRFVYYAIRSTLFQNDVQGRTIETVQKSIKVQDLEKCFIPYFPLPEQRAIAAILGALDDKIELNHQMNQTLKAMAQALFKSWFVDFEPFRDQGMEESPLGPIPMGWRVGTIGDLAEVTSGKRPLDRMTHRTDDYAVPLYGGAGPMAWVQEPLYYEPLLITGRVGTLGVTNRTAKPCWPSDNTLVVLVKFSAAYPFLYYSMKRFDFDSLNRGSTQPLVTQTDLSNVKLALPSMGVLESFSDIVQSIFQLQDSNEEQSQTIATLRDALLPKLLSGEIRVRDAEKFVEEVA